MDTLGRRIVVAFVKQRHLISLALVLGALVSLMQSTPVMAQWVNVDGNRVAKWISKDKIEFGGQTFTDANINDNTWVFNHFYERDMRDDCESKIRFADNPYAENQGKSAFADVETSNGNGAIACGNALTNEPIRMTNRVARCAGDTACIDQTAKEECADNDDTPRQYQDCIARVKAAGNAAPPEEAGGGGGGTEEDSVKCPLNNSLGWIVCPLSEMLGNVTITIAKIIEQLLRTEPLAINAPTLEDGNANKAIYVVWSQVRNLANIALAVAMIWIIYSQATSFGLSNYGIKKMLPKLVVAAIAINISYFVCALIIDIFNLLGAGVAGLFTLMNSAIPELKYNGAESIFYSVLISLLTGLGIGAAGFATLTGTGTAAGASTIGAAMSAMWPLALLALLTITLGILAVLAVLIFRLVAIVLLVIVSPLAFAAWLLPNTEDYFKKWLNSLQNLLVMYPIAMAIIYGSVLGSNLIQNVIVVEAGGFEAYVMQIFALFALAIPLFTLPFLFKFAGALGSRIGASINNPNRGPIDGWRKRARERASDIKTGSALDRRNKVLEKFGDVNTYANRGGNKFTKGLRRGWANSRLMGAGAADRELTRKDAIEDAKKQHQAIRADRIAAGTKQGKFTSKLLGGDGEALRESAAEDFATEQRTANARRMQQHQLARRVASDAHLQYKAAGVAAATGMDRAVAQAESIIEKAEAEEAGLITQQHLKLGTKTPQLVDIATRAGSTAAERRAAIETLAKTSSIGEIRNVRQVYEAAAPRDPNTGEVQRTDELELYNKVLNANASVFSGAPDLNPAHGHGYDGFGKISAGKVAGWHNSTIKAAVGDAKASLTEAQNKRQEAQQALALGTPEGKDRHDTLIDEAKGLENRHNTLLRASYDALGDDRIAPTIDNRQREVMENFLKDNNVPIPRLKTSGTIPLNPAQAQNSPPPPANSSTPPPPNSSPAPTAPQLPFGTGGPVVGGNTGSSGSGPTSQGGGGNYGNPAPPTPPRPQTPAPAQPTPSGAPTPPPNPAPQPPTGISPNPPSIFTPTGSPSGNTPPPQPQQGGGAAPTPPQAPYVPPAATGGYSGSVQPSGLWAPTSTRRASPVTPGTINPLGGAPGVGTPPPSNPNSPGGPNLPPPNNP